jgi:hypothetical protein
MQAIAGLHVAATVLSNDDNDIRTAQFTGKVLDQRTAETSMSNHQDKDGNGNQSINGRIEFSLH